LIIKNKLNYLENEKRENLVKFILNNNNISELFKNKFNKENNRNFSHKEIPKNQINEKDYIDMAEFKIENLEKDIKTIKFMIKSKKKTIKNFSLNKFKVIKSEDIIKQIGVIEEEINDGFGSIKLIDTNILGNVEFKHEGLNFQADGRYPTRYFANYEILNNNCSKIKT